MNDRAPPRLLAISRRALPWLSLMLLPGLTPAGPAPLLHMPERGRHRSPATTGAVPYLPVSGPPPLRFREDSPPPDLVARPPAAAPPRPTTDDAEPPQRPSEPATDDPAASSSPTETSAEPTSEESAPKKPIAILYDQVRPAVRAEDFLPYFQFPAAHHGKATIIVPAPPPLNPSAAPMPPSSATYTRTPE